MPDTPSDADAGAVADEDDASDGGRANDDSHGNASDDHGHDDGQDIDDSPGHDDGQDTDHSHGHEEGSVDATTGQSGAGAVAGTRPPVAGDEPLEEAQRPPPDSRWWYWVAAVPGYFVVATVAGFVVSIFAFVAAVTGANAMEPGVGAPVSIGLGVAGVFAVVVLLVGVGMLLTLLFPVAIYLDADAVADTSGDWTPDPVLYGLLGLAGVVAQPLQAPLAVYYLYRRHQSEGVP